MLAMLPSYEDSGAAVWLTSDLQQLGRLTHYAFDAVLRELFLTLLQAPGQD